MSDVPTDAEIAEANDAADEILGEIMDDLDDEADAPLVMYSLWVSLTQYLAVLGWQPDELAEDAAHHAAVQDSEGSA